MKSFPKLSLCMIAKNEEKFLRKCLASVQGLVDEIIVVDTGSTDRTKEVAGQYGAQVYHFDWCDDFAAARNVSLQHATGDWILMLDADESLSLRDHQKIKNALLSKDKDGFVLVLRNYTNDPAAAGWVSAQGDAYAESAIASGWWEVSKIRLFRNKREIRYQSRIHESVRGHLSPERTGLLALPIHHYGHLDVAGIQQKKVLYRHLGEKKAAEEQDFSSYFELGRQYAGEKNFSRAKAALQRSVELQPDFFEAWSLLGSVFLLSGDLSQAALALEKASQLNSENDAVHMNLGILRARKKEYVGAIASFIKALQLNPLNAAACKNLGLCYDEMGEKQKAYHAFKQAIALYPPYGKKIKLS